MPITTGFVSKRDFNEKKRKEMAKEGQAMPDGSYPIANAGDLENAISLAGMGSHSFESVKAHIIRRAKILGITDKLPESWMTTKKMDSGFSSRSDLTRKCSLPKIRKKGPEYIDALKKKQRHLGGLQSVPMNVEAISASLANANS